MTDNRQRVPTDGEVCNAIAGTLDGLSIFCEERKPCSRHDKTPTRGGLREVDGKTLAEWRSKLEKAQEIGEAKGESGRVDVRAALKLLDALEAALAAPEGEGLSERAADQIMRERDGHEERIGDIARALGLNDEWSSMHDVGTGILEAIRDGIVGRLPDDWHTTPAPPGPPARRTWPVLECEDCEGSGSLGESTVDTSSGPSGRKIACETCGGNEDSLGCGWIQIVSVAPSNDTEYICTLATGRYPARVRTEMRTMIDDIPAAGDSEASEKTGQESE